MMVGANENVAKMKSGNFHNFHNGLKDQLETLQRQRNKISLSKSFTQGIKQSIMREMDDDRSVYFQRNISMYKLCVSFSKLLKLR